MSAVRRFLSALAEPPRPVQEVTSFTVPVEVREDGDEEAARLWLDQQAELAGQRWEMVRVWFPRNGAEQ